MEAYVGGPIAAVRDGDEICIDIPARKLDIRLSEEEIRSRLDGWKPVEREVPPGFMRRYIKLVNSAAKGAVLE
jgi:dihydroxy-acid dehydratase